MVNLKNENIDIAITCIDINETRYFFEKILGLDLVTEFKVDESTANNLGLSPLGFTQTRFVIGSTKIKLLQFDSDDISKANHHIGINQGVRWISLYVDDICQTYKILESEGYEFLGGVPTEPKGILVLKGPEGILIEFIGG
ncbi:MAG: VOC family protein [SAR202 cluster bacterium]|nr:VOC family protein [SAR202 cluster bacterium]|tara:strand:+ start:9473 stop:9895 length:423 start_codon:yes stop_codon:yes gene_type:complete